MMTKKNYRIPWAPRKVKEVEKVVQEALERWAEEEGLQVKDWTIDYLTFESWFEYSVLASGVKPVIAKGEGYVRSLNGKISSAVIKDRETGEPLFAFVPQYREFREKVGEVWGPEDMERVADVIKDEYPGAEYTSIDEKVRWEAIGDVETDDGSRWTFVARIQPSLIYSDVELTVEKR